MNFHAGPHNMNREIFMSALVPHFSPIDMLRIRHAYIMAKHGHRAQVRKELDEHGNPVRYFEHLRRVALNLIRVARCIDATMIIASLLHDALEDSRDLTAEMIEHCFGSDVVTVVKTLSKTPKDGYLERFTMSCDWRPYAIKACDRLDNLQTLSQTSREFMSKQVHEIR